MLLDNQTIIEKGEKRLFELWVLIIEREENGLDCDCIYDKIYKINIAIEMIERGEGLTEGEKEQLRYNILELIAPFEIQSDFSPITQLYAIRTNE